MLDLRDLSDLLIPQKPIIYRILKVPVCVSVHSQITVCFAEIFMNHN